MSTNLFITGIGTDVGKTVVSAILTEALEADYWKPVQSGTIDSSDKITVANLISNQKTKIHPEVYSFKEPVSPHLAAALENTNINLSNIQIPSTTNNLIIEGAGGIMVPLNEREFVSDLILQLNTKIVLVISHYLGSINHSLLSIEYLKQKNIPVLGIIFNGEINKASQQIIEKHSPYKTLGIVEKLNQLDKISILKEAVKFKHILNE